MLGDEITKADGMNIFIVSATEMSHVINPEAVPVLNTFRNEHFHLFN